MKGKVEKLVFGGNGLIRHEGMVVFVPFTAPEDEIEFSITSQKKSFAFGKLEKILQPSPFRTQPVCPYFGTCGGCQLQHVDEKGQNTYKRQVVQEGLRFENVNLVPSELKYGYRRHITLTLEKGQAGYHDVEGNFLPIKLCPIFKDLEASAITWVNQKCSELNISDAKATLMRDHERMLIHFDFKRSPANFKPLERDGVSLAAPGMFKSWGNIYGEDEAFGVRYRYSARAFLQNNREQSLHLYQNILDRAQLEAPKRIIDLYSGIGITSLALSRIAPVIAIESNPYAVELAKTNKQLNKIENVEFVLGKAEDVLKKVLTTDDLLIVNPPREGLHPHVKEAIKAKGIKKILYISCNPATLNRDIRDLECQIKDCTAFDMFPQTGHVETVANLISN